MMDQSTGPSLARNFYQRSILRDALVWISLSFVAIVYPCLPLTYPSDRTECGLSFDLDTDRVSRWELRHVKAIRQVQTGEASRPEKESLKPVGPFDLGANIEVLP